VNDKGNKKGKINTAAILAIKQMDKNKKTEDEQ